MIAYHRLETLDGNGVTKKIAEAVGCLNIDRVGVPAEGFHSQSHASGTTGRAQRKIPAYIKALSQTGLSKCNTASVVVISD